MLTIVMIPKVYLIFCFCFFEIYQILQFFYFDLIIIEFNSNLKIAKIKKIVIILIIFVNLIKFGKK